MFYQHFWIIYASTCIICLITNLYICTKRYTWMRWNRNGEKKKRKGDNFSLRQDKLCFILYPNEVTAREILRVLENKQQTYRMLMRFGGSWCLPISFVRVIIFSTCICMYSLWLLRAHAENNFFFCIYISKWVLTILLLLFSFDYCT